MTWQLVLSLVLASVTFYLLLVLVERISRDMPLLRRLLLWGFNNFGSSSSFRIGFFIGVFVIIYMILFNWRRYMYMNQISQTVEHIAKGNLNDRFPVKQSNEVTVLANHMNALVEQLSHSLEEERRAEQTKNELVTNVSHDLRTPLTSILGYLGLIEQDRYRDEVELRQYVQIAYDKSERLKLLIDDLFEYTRMRHDAVAMKQVSLNLVEMMKQLLVHYRLTIEEANMVGQVHASDQSIVVLGDPDKLIRVFENLLMNAITYGSDGGKVDIHVHKSMDVAIVEVVNYGEPIPAGDLPQLFERFYRIDKSRTEHEGGTGLGLAIAKGLVERQGGTISVTSDRTSTCFQVKLPLGL